MASLKDQLTSARGGGACEDEMTPRHEANQQPIKNTNQQPLMLLLLNTSWHCVPADCTDGGSVSVTFYSTTFI